MSKSQVGYLLFLGTIFLFGLFQVYLYSKVSSQQIQSTQPHTLFGSFFTKGRLHFTKATAGILGGSSGGISLQCENEESGPCCSSWDVNADDWWNQHPDWEVSLESDDQFCFSPMENSKRASFFRTVHRLQWRHNKHHNCSMVIQANQSNAGYSASINQITYGFWAAYQQGQPFQITKHRPQMQWMYAPNETWQWGYCPSRDMNCYYLPLSDCPAETAAEQKYHAERAKTRQDSQFFQWLRLYATRPRQHVRKRVYDYITKDQGLPPLPWNVECTAMHIRRGDAGFVKFPYRRYAAVQEYIDKGQVPEGGTIVLLTDDISTIEEVEQYHSKKYNWIYTNRTRRRGLEGGFSRHIISGDQAFEVVTIMAEIKLASQCGILVHGHSGFVMAIEDGMEVANKKFKKRYVETRMKEADAKKLRNMDAQIRTDKMWQEIQAKNQHNGR